MSQSQGIAILGAGIFAKEAHLPALAALGDSAPLLKAVYSRSEKSSKDLADAAVATLGLQNTPAIYHDGDSASNLDVLLGRADIVAVIVVLPITTQPAIILKALAAGKHVLSEKPVAADVRSGIELIDRYNKEFKPKGRVWRVAENYEAEQGIQNAAKILRSGKIGNIRFFKATVLNYVGQDSKWYKTPWRTVPDYQGGFLLDGGVHTIAALRVMLPRPLTKLTAIASLNQEYLKPHDTIHAIAQGGDDFHGIVEMTFALPTKTSPPRDGFVITGSKGWISVNVVYPENESAFVRILTTTSTVEKEGEPPKEKQETLEVPSNGVGAELASFFGFIQGKDDKSGFGDPLGALADVAFIQASLNSGGSIVDLERLVREG
ncbi:oxidoreductase family protein [Crepidotus variabilis]|uniref:Oxidoreductase family protein n=1 Tax=Crepidotus variabilis TaxID=179855 RepID=A0A9P6ELF9_9AGAR|nr:oxidoreductase family protein [Crepidotus variabilis]